MKLRFAIIIFAASFSLFTHSFFIGFLSGLYNLKV